MVRGSNPSNGCTLGLGTLGSHYVERLAQPAADRMIRRVVIINSPILWLTCSLFDYHLRLHDSQTGGDCSMTPIIFDYHLRLHDSQTKRAAGGLKIAFDYHLRLHDSQTRLPACRRYRYFDYHLRLHDSQTPLARSPRR